MIEIHEAGNEHYSLIHDIAHQTWPHTFSNFISKEQISYMMGMLYSVAALRKQVEESGHIFILAKYETGYLGFASYEINFQNSAMTKIQKIYILPAAQGKGVGKQLIHRISEIAQQNNNPELTLNVNKHNPAIQFYLHLGFQKVAEVNIPIGNGFVMEDYIMNKPLLIDVLNKNDDATISWEE